MDPGRRTRLDGALCGLGAAALFGASAPLAKLLVRDVAPVMLAGLLYVGGGVGLSLWRLAAPPRGAAAEPGLSRRHLPTLAAMVFSGSLLGPVLMLAGLARVSGLTSSLLLNLEAPLTMLIAVGAFRDHLGRAGVVAATLVVSGGMLLSLTTGAAHADPLGVLLLVGACAAWGLDNNLTQRISLRDPVAIVRVKALAGGSINLLIAALLGESLPSPHTIAWALGLGTLSYGLSIVLDVYALRFVGAAREAAYFATAPFVGAALAVPLFGEVPHPLQCVAVALMAAGVALLVRERHAHSHSHAAEQHEHLHVHDAHHQHPHDGSASEPHSHRHSHTALTHDHQHVPDTHHHHRH